MSFHDIQDVDIANLLEMIDAKPDVKPEPAVVQSDPVPAPVVPDEIAVVESIVQSESVAVESVLDEIQAETIKKEIYTKQAEAEKAKPKKREKKPKKQTLEAFPDVRAYREYSAPAAKPKRQRTKKPAAPKTPSFDVQAAIGNLESTLDELGMGLGQPHPFTGEPVTDDCRERITKIGNQKQLKAIVNALAWKAGRDSPYVYTRYAIEALKAAPGIGWTKKEIEQHYLEASVRAGTRTLADSTAKSQAEKYWHVLPALKLARVDGEHMLAEPCCLSLAL
jgi:hypothetical protein